MKIGYFGLWPYHQAQHTPACIIRREHIWKAQPRQTNNYMDGEHNREVRIWLCVHASVHSSISYDNCTKQCFKLAVRSDISTCYQRNTHLLVIFVCLQRRFPSLFAVRCLSPSNSFDFERKERPTCNALWSSSRSTLLTSRLHVATMLTSSHSETCWCVELVICVLNLQYSIALLDCLHALWNQLFD